jgi:hypothetical protein
VSFALKTWNCARFSTRTPLFFLQSEYIITLPPIACAEQRGVIPTVLGPAALRGVKLTLAGVGRVSALKRTNLFFQAIAELERSKLYQYLWAYFRIAAPRKDAEEQKKADIVHGSLNCSHFAFDVCIGSKEEWTMFKQWDAMGENKRAVEWAVAATAAAARDFSGGPLAAMDDRKSRCRQNSDELSRKEYPVHTFTVFHDTML